MMMTLAQFVTQIIKLDLEEDSEQIITIFVENNSSQIHEMYHVANVRIGYKKDGEKFLMITTSIPQKI
jgi:hypothetical protein